MNNEYHKKVMTMTEFELLSEVVDNPELLTDSYYNTMAQSIYQRFDELKKINIDKL